MFMSEPLPTGGAYRGGQPMAQLRYESRYEEQGERRQEQRGGYQEMEPAGVGRDFESALTGDMRLSLHDFVQSTTVCEWCADQCIGMGPEMEECARLCRDVASLAAINVAFLARDSPFGLDLAETFVHAAEECADECARHPEASSRGSTARS